jgi:hypothetical protein
MTTRMRKMPDLDVLFEAADAHAAETGNADHAVVGLQSILRAAWRLLTPAQRRAFFAEPELQELSELPEYELLIGDLTRRDGDPADERTLGDSDIN